MIQDSPIGFYPFFRYNRSYYQAVIEKVKFNVRMTILALGLNHKTAQLALREQLSFTKEHVAQKLPDLANFAHLQEVAMISTCNRTEFYGHEGSVQLVMQWLSKVRNIAQDVLWRTSYVLKEQEAVTHLMRVASGLDSMVLGEPQILGQLKQAYNTAQNAGTLGRVLERLFQASFAVAKQVRTQTAIGTSPVSVAYAAVKLATHIFATLSDKTVLLVGAGETVTLVARHLHEQGVRQFIFANRTKARAQALAHTFKGSVIDLDALAVHLPLADVVLVATGSEIPLINQASIKQAIKQRKYRPMYLLDLGVPRDIDPSVGALEDVYLYTIDDLQGMIDANYASRQAAVDAAELIIAQHSMRYMNWLRMSESVHLIRAYREQAFMQSDQLLQQAKQAIAQGKPVEQVLELFAHQLTAKLLHQPSVQLRQASEMGDADTLEIAQQLLGIKTQ